MDSVTGGVVVGTGVYYDSPDFWWDGLRVVVSTTTEV